MPDGKPFACLARAGAAHCLCRAAPASFLGTIIAAHSFENEGQAAMIFLISQRYPQFILGLAVVLVLLILSACDQSPSSGAAAAIEAYQQGLVAKDADRLANLSCAAWEANARTELASFGAVATTLEEVECHEAGEDENFTLVTCTGKILADYNGEILEIDLAERTYQAVYEAGDWRMCGYQ